MPTNISQQPRVLKHAERLTLADLCDTLMPAIVPEVDDNPQLFALDAASLGVPGAMEEAFATLARSQQLQIRLLLRALERPLVNRLLAGTARSFHDLEHPERQRVLLALARSRSSSLRAGFQGLKRLATFLFYSLLDGDGTNPTWPAIGYSPSSNQPARDPSVKLTHIAQRASLECDVCVIGSGAGGGVVAAELARHGKRVIVLEAGTGLQAPDFDQRELAGMRALFLDQGLTTTHDQALTILAGATLGGGTTVNWQTSLRLPAAIRDEWAALSGCSHFVEESFERSFDAVAHRLNINEQESILNPNNARLRAGCDALGYHWRTIPRNARDCAPAQCGYCTYGCRHGGKQGTAVTYLADAQAYGDTTIIPGCRAEQVLIENKRVQGVRAAIREVSTGRSHRLEVRSPIVVVAAGALHSPALLLRSGLDLPAIGRNLFLHPTSAIAGIYEERIESWSGPPQTVICDHFSQLSPGYGFRIEAVPAHPGLLALALPWFGARDHRRYMQQAAHICALIVLVRDRVGGKVEVARDGRLSIKYQPGLEERVRLAQGIEATLRIHAAAGAREVLTLQTRRHVDRAGTVLGPADVDVACRTLAGHPLHGNWSTLFSAHQMGTCRMGRDPRTAVCDATGGVFGVKGLFIGDASAFPASSGDNPMLTVMALAHHTAQAIKAI